MQSVVVSLLGHRAVWRMVGYRFRRANGGYPAEPLLWICVFYLHFFGFCFQLPHVFVNCVECFTLRLLLEQILNKLNHLSSSEGECSTQITCETFNDFVRLFKQITKAESLKDQTVYIVSIISYLKTDLLDQFPYFSFETYVQCIVQGAYAT